MIKKLLQRPYILCFIGIVIYFLSIVWINFHGALWNQMDIYSYVLEGKLIYEAKSCFPKDWIFGNQFHIIASPNIAALFYGITHDSSHAMALASSLSSLLILLSFWWCFKEDLSRKGMAIGLLCIGGGIIFGTNAGTYISGLQVLHTMASFYACYLIVLLITLGCYFRLKKKDSIPWMMIILSFLTNFALGMQSPRELLILSIPLIIIEGLSLLTAIAKHETVKDVIFQNTALFFALGVFIAEVTGHFYMQSLHVPSTSMIGEITLDLAPSAIFANLWASTKNIIRIAGISIVVDSIRYLPLSLGALLISLSIPWSILRIIKEKDGSVLAQAIVFSIISVAGVYFVGIFLMRTRDIYYFVYWLLAALSVSYYFQNNNGKLSLIPGIAFFLICSTNYYYTFFPNYHDYRQNSLTVSNFAQKLANDGITTIYVDATPIIAASSNDKIISQSFWLDVGQKSGYPLNVFPSDKYIPAYDDEHYGHCLISFSNYYLRSFPQLPEEYKKALFSNLVFYDELIIDKKRIVFYKPIGRLIAPLSMPE